MEVLKQTRPVARKQHRCMLCGGIIEVNTKYNKLTIKNDGHIYDWISHQECNELVSYLNMMNYNDDDVITEETFKECIEDFVYDNHYDNSIDDIAKDWDLPYHELVIKILNELKTQDNGSTRQKK